jgi:hypothetical protein
MMEPLNRRQGERIMTRAGRKPADAPPPEPARKPLMTAQLWKGVFPQGQDGQALTLAVIDSEGHIIDQGDAVSGAAWDAALKTYWKHLQDIGAMHVHEKPPGRH